MQSSLLNVRWTNFLNGFKSEVSKFLINEAGVMSIISTSCLALQSMVLRKPQEIVAVRNPEISMSSFEENK